MTAALIALCAVTFGIAAGNGPRLITAARGAAQAWQPRRTPGGKSHRPARNLTTRGTIMPWFGEGPLNEQDAKFFDLRESGYTGPVDQDGNAVEDLAQWIREHS